MKKNIHDNYVFLIVGAFQDKKYYEEITQKRADLNLTEVVLFTNYREDVSSFYSCADAFFLSSCSEGLPMVVLEAMSCKLPVVSTSVGGLPKVLSDGAGILVAPRSPDELALAMKSLLNNEDDCRNSLAMAGYEKMVKFYSLERMSRDYLNVFSGLEL
jgi:glycosyltransferase involved in cell wall biosynthesis